MRGNGHSGMMGRGVLLIALALLALTALRPPALGLNLTINRAGTSFELKALFVKIAFDFGQSCSKSNTCPGIKA
jgi:hypothetical protein